MYRDIWKYSLWIIFNGPLEECGRVFVCRDVDLCLYFIIFPLSFGHTRRQSFAGVCFASSNWQLRQGLHKLVVTWLVSERMVVVETGHNKYKFSKVKCLAKKSWSKTITNFHWHTGCGVLRIKCRWKATSLVFC